MISGVPNLVSRSRARKIHFPYEEFNRDSYETLEGSFSGFGLPALVPLAAALDCAGLALVPLAAALDCAGLAPVPLAAALDSAGLACSR